MLHSTQWLADAHILYAKRRDVQELAGGRINIPLLVSFGTLLHQCLRHHIQF